MKIGIYGTGVFALALSSIFVDNKCDVTMWTKFKEEKEELEKNHKSRNLPNYKITDKIKITNSLKEVSKDKDLIVIALPVPFIESTLKESPTLLENKNILIASKGITEDKLLVSELINKYIVGAKIAVIGGGTFAKDLPEKKPLAFTLATRDEDLKRICTLALKNKYVKLEYTNDIEGIEFLSSIKNIYAIIGGLLDGLGTNESEESLFLTEALKDEREILSYLGCNESDVLTYAGIGDLVLTCKSKTSRNYTFGYILGKDGIKNAKKYLKENTVEGYATLNNISELILSKKLESNLIETLVNIVNEVCPKENIIETLMTN